MLSERSSTPRDPGDHLVDPGHPSPLATIAFVPFPASRCPSILSASSTSGGVHGVLPQIDSSFEAQK
jgi:hypothetical protein